MRFRNLIVAATLAATSTLHASQTIEQSELDATLLEAQLAIEAREYEQAFELYNQAAQWGHKGAQYVLGELYLRGEGVAQNRIMGLAWLDVAAESRDRAFVKARNQAAQSMSETDLEKASVVADRIAAVYGIEAAQVTCKLEMRVGSNIKVTNCYHTQATGDSIFVPEDKSDLLAQLQSSTKSKDA
jgi:TPR repeat protein